MASLQSNRKLVVKVVIASELLIHSFPTLSHVSIQSFKIFHSSGKFIALNSNLMIADCSQ